MSRGFDKGSAVLLSRMVPPIRALLVPAAALWLVGCSVAGRPLSDDAELPRGMPDVRVGIAVNAPAIELASTGRLQIATGREVHADGGGPWTVVREGTRLEARSVDGTVSVEGTFVARPISGRVRVNGTGYHGAVLFRAAPDGVTAVNVLDLETYLRGVVPLEIGAGRPPEVVEAVKAQAIAARTYAIRQLGRREALGFDYYGSILDQAYGGADAEDPVASRAVTETRGIVLTYRGEPIEAFYHSTCGGRTAALEEVWNGEPRPYLRSVSDGKPWGRGHYCESSSRFRWTEEWTEADLLETLATAFGGSRPTRVDALELDGRTRSGRAAALVVRTDVGERRVRGDSIRRVLRPEPGRLLNSTAIELRTRGRGQVRELTVEGRGWGHGIGMCQVGALGRAEAGHSYRDILTTYYPGTRLVRLY